MSTKHSPLPWRVGLSPAFGYPLLLTSEGYAITDEINGITLETADANAAHIVKCVNLHYDLVDAMQSLMEFWDHNTPVFPGSDQAERIKELLTATGSI